VAQPQRLTIFEKIVQKIVWTPQQRPPGGASNRKNKKPLSRSCGKGAKTSVSSAQLRTELGLRHYQPLVALRAASFLSQPMIALGPESQ
jgi:hypothetical protein